MILTLTAAALLLVAPLHAASVTLNECDSRVIVKADGTAQIDYTIIFTEQGGGRREIKTIGPLTPAHKIVKAYGYAHAWPPPDNPTATAPEGAVPFDVKLDPLGDAKYHASLSTNTRNGEQYAVTIRYQTTNWVVDRTKVNGQDYLALTWSPPEWALPIGKQRIDVILPVVLDNSIRQPEQVTDAVVNATGLKTSQKESFVNYPRQVYYPTPDTESGKTYLSLRLEHKDLAANGKGVFVIFLPEKHFTLAAAGKMERESRNAKGQTPEEKAQLAAGKQKVHFP